MVDMILASAEQGRAAKNGLTSRELMDQIRAPINWPGVATRQISPFHLRLRQEQPPDPERGGQVKRTEGKKIKRRVPEPAVRNQTRTVSGSWPSRATTGRQKRPARLVGRTALLANEGI
jgi:hypothetical protein